MRDDLASLEGSNVLIIGGIGFIGSNLAMRLVGLGASVLLVDSMNPLYGGNLRNIAPIKDRVRVNIADVRDKHSLSYLVRDQQYIFNLAGQTSHMDSMADPVTDLEINCTAQLSLLEVCRAYNPDAKLVFASTRQIYGRPQYLPVDEKHPIRPVDVNGINKTAGEFYHILYNDVYGIRATVLRLTNTYGPRMRIKDARQTFLGIWIKSLLQGAPIDVWGGTQLRDFNYVDDVVDALLIAALDRASDGKVYNVGSDEILSLEEVARLLTDFIPGAHYSVREYPPERRKIDIGDYYSDFTLFRTSTGWTPKTSFREGVEKTVKFFQDNMDYYA
ncbi:NAD-dependent epimerase/dehydratase family protein [Azospirillum soli]|uniref:NAD-dependent epimerase/dehydratase family protein n=1 Tax=Azospirillum soli TaxID=1304799 RepID=UPI001AE5D184|nr:NAD-dependent epimerase/dehydratase family protein [Azospirillum soli]MBP2316563.1 nucleoside-diphosphate-sugar epimerase [Azospirillum soli]